MGILEVQLLNDCWDSGEVSSVVVAAATGGIARRPGFNGGLMCKEMAELVEKEVSSSDQDFVNPRLFLGFDRGEVAM
ncbi:OLC1v1017103C1 [Oldenlandia corymbosa var. corymbosa]|uniref:OLC1v1017103C1 n=1 Tax=Oldenlandia corymbosa var. corymbosa TaxID=529605 RepID=A0AAV1E8M8_OLDCO|nr:OLC1v1017103C1 [Oldenlandia corymbosa var. corymbosa]